MPEKKPHDHSDLIAPVDVLDPRNPVALNTLRHALPSPAPLIDRPILLAPHFNIAVIGDIRIDIRSHLPGRRFVQISADEQTKAPVTIDIGGTALSFARAASPHFRKISVIGAVGQDPWTEFIQRRCTTSRIESCVTEVPGPNSLVIVLRDQGDADNPHGLRLIVSDRDSPYARLDSEHILARREVIEQADALVIDGYALLSETTAYAMDTAVDIAVKAGVPVCFDVVPHRLDQHIRFEELEPFLARSSMITTEAHTLLRLLGRPVPEMITDQHAVDLVTRLPVDLAGWQRTWLIRYGYGNMDKTSAISPSHHHVTYYTGYAQAESPAGYGYYVAAAELKWWLTNLVQAKARYPLHAQHTASLTAGRRRQPRHGRHGEAHPTRHGEVRPSRRVPY